MIILYRVLLATSRISINVSRGPFKTLSSTSRLTWVRVKVFHSSSVVRSSPKWHVRWHVLATTPLGIFLYNRLTPGVVQCKTQSSANQQLLLRKAHRNVSRSEVAKFNWTRLVKLMLPDILLLAGAIVVSGVRVSDHPPYWNTVFRVQL